MLYCRLMHIVFVLFYVSGIHFIILLEFDILGNTYIPFLAES